MHHIEHGFAHEGTTCMNIQSYISKTIFHAFLFAMGGAPTLAMWIVQAQNPEQDVLLTAFVSVTVILACILVPIILFQNSFLLFKRQSANVEARIQPLYYGYLILNIVCLIYWLLFTFKWI